MWFSNQIIPWYQKNLRKLPWRETKDPYKIWISEVILQQTRVDQGLPYYNNFLKAFPTIQKLAIAEENQVLKLWQGLGYYSRARNLHTTAKQITTKRNGHFPTDYHDILKLKGVGTYTAAAISSFCYGKPYPVLDGNVYRVISRVFGIYDDIDSPAGKKIFSDKLSILINVKQPGLFNQAMMEFGALQCVPGIPNCNKCIFKAQCHAYNKNVINQLPKRSKKVSIRIRYFNYMMINDNNSFFLQKRTKKDIWQNLYEPLLIESDKVLNRKEIMSTKEWMRLFSKGIVLKNASKVYCHKLTHQTIFARFWVIKSKGPVKIKELRRIKQSEIKNYPMSKLIETYIDNISVNNCLK